MPPLRLALELEFADADGSFCRAFAWQMSDELHTPRSHRCVSANRTQNRASLDTYVQGPGALWLQRVLSPDDGDATERPEDS